MFYDLKNLKTTMPSHRIGMAACTLATLLLVASNGLAQEATTTTTTTTVDAGDSSVAGITQAEVIRRQELVFRATQAIAQGERAEANGDTAMALEKYKFAVDNLSESPSTAAALQKARAGIVRISIAQYKEAKKNADTPGAVKALETAAQYDPNNRGIKEQLAKIKETQKEPAKGDVLGNPAVTPAFMDDLKEIDQLFTEAEQFRRSGQYDEAEARYKKIISIDKYNTRAAEGLKQITNDKLIYAKASQMETREERLRQVEEKWATKPKRDITGPATQVSSTPFTRSTQFAVNQKLKSYILKDIVFNDASIEDAANALAVKSKELDTDPAKLGISFIVKPEAVASAKPFSINLRNIPMEEALRYITKLANVKFKVEEFAVVIVPLKEPTEVVLRRSFNVPPSFFPPPSVTRGDKSGGTSGGRKPPAIVASGGSDTSSTNDVKSQLEERGVDFKAPNSGAVYYPASGVLQVVNTQEQLDLIEELVNAGTTPTYMVDVQTKLVEISQTDLNELTVNGGLYANGSAVTFGTNPLGSIPSDASGQPTGQAAATTALRGSQGFNVNGIDSLLHGNSSPMPNIFNIQGHLGPQAFNFVIAAMSQKRSFDVLSAPSLRVKNSEDATINVSRTFSYPTAFDPAESAAVQTVSDSSGTRIVGPPVVVPTFPTEFETRDIGVKMKIRPQLGSDNKTIDLALFPEVTDFEGFVNYGSPIYVVAGDNTSYLLSNNVINQPIFNTRRVDTKVLIRDGYTVVLGGLMRDDVQTITDKVPFLGDLPLLGRLFQSKATQSQKKNLLIFVTCRIYLNSGELLNPPAAATPALGGVPTAQR